MQKVKLVTVTDNAEEIVVYCARVSSPNQSFRDPERLLNYCAKHKHWSIWEQADMTVEITTSRAISAQLIRHRSFCFQEFSQRYAETQGYQFPEARGQDPHNRQASLHNVSQGDQNWWERETTTALLHADSIYKEALKRGIARESARMILPMCTETKLYMKGNARSWIHYLEVRNGPETQEEHRGIAVAIQELFVQQFPITARALWGDK